MGPSEGIKHDGRPVLVVVVETRRQEGLSAAVDLLRAERIWADIISVHGTEITRELWQRLPLLAVVGPGGTLLEGKSFDPQIPGEMLDALSQSLSPHFVDLEANPQGR